MNRTISAKRPRHPFIPSFSPNFQKLVVIFWVILSFPSMALADKASDLFNQAHEIVAKQDYKQAIQTLKAAIEMYPRFAEAHHLLGIVYFTGLNQPDKAVSALKQAITHYPNFARAYLDLGTVLLHQKKTADAEAAYQKALQLYPDYLEARLATANLYGQTKRPQKSIRAYAAVLELQPDDPEILYRLAYWHNQANETKEAQVMLDRLLKVDDKHLEGWLLQGEISEKENNPHRAIDSYLKALSIKGDLLHPHNALGFLYQEQGNSQSAAKHIKEVIRLAPEDPDAHLNLGVVLSNLKQLDEAEKEYLTAISLNPKFTDAYFNLGVFYEFHRKDTEKALAQYREYLKLGGTDERISQLVKKVEK